jgi:hypothetical protein
MIQQGNNFILSKMKLIVISKRICDTDKLEVRYRAENFAGRHIFGCRISDRKTPLSLLLETIQSDLQAVM